MLTHFNPLVTPCRRGLLDEMKKLEEKHLSSINKNDAAYLLSTACAFGHLHIVEYLLTTPHVMTKFDLHDKANLPLTEAVISNQLAVVKYITSSPNLTQHAHIDKNSIMFAANSEYLELFQYMIKITSIKNPNIIDKFNLTNCSPVVLEWIEKYKKSQKEANHLHQKTDAKPNKKIVL